MRLGAIIISASPIETLTFSILPPPSTTSSQSSSSSGDDLGLPRQNKTKTLTVHINLSNQGEVYSVYYSLTHQTLKTLSLVFCR